MDQNSDVPTLCEALVHCGVCEALDPATGGIRQAISKARRRCKRADLIPANEPSVTRHVSGKDGREAALDASFRHVVHCLQEQQDKDCTGDRRPSPRAGASSMGRHEPEFKLRHYRREGGFGRDVPTVNQDRALFACYGEANSAPDRATTRSEGSYRA